MKPIEIDGRTGEGGGQLVRNAIALAAVTSQQVKITNVRGKRPGKRGGGLKSQHVTSIEWLAKATGAAVKGLEVGSKTLEFNPRRGPGGLLERNINIRAESPAASALLIFQAVFPFLLFAGNETDEPIELTISGGTNVSFSPSYEYLDQVFLPALEDWFGVRVARKLQSRGWNSGSASRGSLWFSIQPVSLGSTLRSTADLVGMQPKELIVNFVHATIIAPSNMHAELQNALGEDLQHRLPGASLEFKQAEESKHDSRIYVLLVAKSETTRWGRDLLYRRKRKEQTLKALAEEISKTITTALCDDMRRGGMVDEFLQDQLVIFQALAQGETSFPRSNPHAEASQQHGGDTNEIETGVDQVSRELVTVKGPFGDSGLDSTHTTTARWVTSEILEPRIKWYNQGALCEGIALMSGCG